MIELGVTVTARQGYRWAHQAREKAAEWGLPWVDRPLQGGLDALLANEVKALLVYGGNGWVLRDALGEFAFSPGMATVRIKRLALQQDQPDQLVRLAELRPGDSLIDATLGLAADALVCASIVGPEGSVVGVEASRAVYLLVSEGLKSMRPFAHSCEVQAVFSSALDYLRTRPTGAVDCVLLDPMFQRPKRSASAFDGLRRFALHEPLTRALLNEARRVARRWVVVKCGRYDRTVRELGLELVGGSPSSPVVWARLGPSGHPLSLEP